MLPPNMTLKRAAAEALMIDTCLIERHTGTTTDDLTGAVVDTYTQVYSGKCKFQSTPGAAIGQRADPGEATAVVGVTQVHLPVATSAGIRRGDRVTATACVNDPDLVGRVLKVKDNVKKSFATAHRLTVEEVD